MGAERLSPQAILGAMQRGEFDATTGVELADYTVTDGAVAIRLVPRSRSRTARCSLARAGACSRMYR